LSDRQIPFVKAIVKNPRRFLVAIGLKISEVSWVYILTIFIVVYATGQLGLPRTLLLNAIFHRGLDRSHYDFPVLLAF
jgi:MHS family shikimate/dehydroshikimate transporter-like MFS transporter